MDPDLLKLVLGAGGLPAVAFYLLGIVSCGLYIRNSRNGHSNRSIIAKLDETNAALEGLTGELQSLKADQRLSFAELSADMRDAITTAASDARLDIKNLEIVVRGQGKT